MHACVTTRPASTLACAVDEIVRDRPCACARFPSSDLAYQGFGDAIDCDGAVCRVRRDALPPLPSSLSKSFSLYGERVARCRRRLRQGLSRARAVAAKALIRAHYSNPPTLACDRTTEALLARTARAVGGRARTMRDRISDRATLSSACTSACPAPIRYMLAQRGMFSYSGLTESAVAHAARGFLCLCVDTGRSALPRSIRAYRRRGRVDRHA